MSEPCGLMRMRLGEEHRARSEVIAADLRRRERSGVAHVGVADDRQVVAIRLERRERRRAEIEVATLAGRRPHVLLQCRTRAAGGAVHHLDRHEAETSACRRLANAVAAGSIASRERQRDGRAQALQHRPARQVLRLSDTYNQLLNSEL